MSEREILFRGKRVDNGEWIEGYFLPGSERQSLHPCIFVYLPETQSFECFDIDIDTLGEYTGLTDKNGTRIFEGDILKYLTFAERIVVAFNENKAAFILKIYDDGVFYDYEETFNGFESESYEVIGNIHENPSEINANAPNSGENNLGE